MTFRSGARSLNARLSRLEQRVPEPRGPIVYRAMFHDQPWPGPGDDPRQNVPPGAHGTHYLGNGVTLHIARWMEPPVGAE